MRICRAMRHTTKRFFASTTGSDADWVVKLIDVYPDQVPDDRPMGGYQLMVTGEILRGRYRAVHVAVSLRPACALRRAA